MLVQAVAFETVQVKVLAAPEETEVGLADRLAAGAAKTVTVATLLETEPPGPVQLI
jgi:hypothetical protein